MARPGDVIQGRYQIMEEIGKGGGGIVFLAFHLSMRQYVVLKEIRYASLYVDAELLRNEVDILKRLKHADLPQVYDYIDIDGTVFTVMEYIPGQSIQEYLRDHPEGLTQEQVVIWARELAGILNYMHTRDQPVIHRDVKPSNIMLRPDGSLCLIDFNISDDAAKGVGPGGYSNGYASPEQLEKAYYQERRIPSPHIRIDARSDIYSMGGVLYFLLTGEVPGTDPGTLCDDQRFFYPLAKIVDTCLEKDPSNRYQSAQDLLYALNHLEKTDEDYIRLTWIHRAVITAGLLLMIAGVGLMVFGFNVRQKRLYYQAYNQFTDMVSSGDENLEKAGEDILNNDQWSGYLKDHPEERAKILYHLAHAKMKNQQYSAALSYYAQALDTGRAEEDCYIDYFDCCMDAGYIQRGEEVLEEAGNLPVSDDARKMMEARLALAKGEKEEARGIFIDLYEHGGSDDIKGRAGSRLGQMYLEEEDYMACQEILEKKKNPDLADLLNLSQAYEYNNQRDRAYNLLIRVISDYPDDPTAYVRLGIMDYSQGHNQKARAWYEEAKKHVHNNYKPDGYETLEAAFGS